MSTPVATPSTQTAAITPPQPPSPNSQGGFGLRVKRMVAAKLTSRAVMRPGFAVLRRVAPVLRLGKVAVASRHALVLDALNRDGEFTIHEVNGPPIDRINGPFILSMDRGPEYERDQATLRRCARREDVERVRTLARETAARQTEAAKGRRRIEAVQEVTRLVPAEVVATYYGFPGPDRITLVRWLRNLFQDAFSNPLNDPFVRQAALRSAAELKAWTLAEIPRRRAAGVEDADDMLGRMIALQGPERAWMDDDWVRRNVAGVIVGAVDTISRFSILALDELLERPAELRAAQAAARAGDLDLVRQYAWEAVRFNPHTPLMARACPRGATLGGKTIKPGTTVLLGTDSAMMDPAAFPEPGRFRVDRDARSYLHFGWGMHQCFGLHVNGVVIPEIVAALLRLPNLRRAPGAEGRVTLDGPFPDRLVLEFD